MKIEFRRKETRGVRRVGLHCGGELVCTVSEGDVKVTDWKNASEAHHACLEELKKWIDEKPPKPEQLTVSEAWRACDDGNGAMSDTIAAIEKRTREICSWEQEHGE